MTWQCKTCESYNWEHPTQCRICGKDKAVYVKPPSIKPRKGKILKGKRRK